MNIKIQSPEGTINLYWSNDDVIRHYEYYQTGGFIYLMNGTKLNGPSELSFDMFKSLLTEKIQYNFNWFINSIGQSLNDDAKIISVGSGASTLELILSQYYKNSTFYLVDKEEFNLTKDSLLFTDTGKHGNTVFQNSWQPVLDALATNNIDSARFNLLTPTDNWPVDADLVDSIWSWGWHYNYLDYIQKSFDSLKIGGRLRLTVLTLPNSSKQFIEEISTKFHCDPVIESITLPATYRSRLQFPDSNQTGQTGGLYVWKK